MKHRATLNARIAEAQVIGSVDKVLLTLAATHKKWVATLDRIEVPTTQMMLGMVSEAATLNGAIQVELCKGLASATAAERARREAAALEGEELVRKQLVKKEDDPCAEQC